MAVGTVVTMQRTGTKANPPLRLETIHRSHPTCCNGNGVYSASIYYRKAEDISIKFVPEHNGQEAIDFKAVGCMGPPIGVWNIDDWQRIDTSTIDIMVGALN
eukprot:5259249-Amphidinium_carterae.2